MAETLNVSTPIIVQTADGIDGCNERIQKALDEARAAISSLKNSWTGAAANHAQDRFSKYYQQCYDARYDVMKGMAHTLRGVVAVNFEEAEKKNIGIASEFI